MDHPWPLFCLLSVFPNKQFKKLMWKCPSSIWCKDSNSQPLKPESSPITRRPGLLAGFKYYDRHLYRTFIYCERRQWLLHFQARVKQLIHWWNGFCGVHLGQVIYWLSTLGRLSSLDQPVVKRIDSCHQSIDDMQPQSSKIKRENMAL